MTEIATHTLAVILTALLTLLGVWIKAASERRAIERGADVKLEETRSRLALDLLKAAREERAEMQAEIDRWKSLAAHLDDFELAMAHIEALLVAEGTRQRAAVERAARDFLGRIQAKRRNAQLIRSEAQLAASAANLAADARRK